MTRKKDDEVREKLPPALEVIRDAVRDCTHEGFVLAPAEEGSLRKSIEKLWSLGDQGKAAVGDFIAGNKIRMAAMHGEGATYGWSERRDLLLSDLLRLESGETIFGTAQEMLGDDFPKFKASWIAAQRRASKKHRAPTVPSVATALAPGKVKTVTGEVVNGKEVPSGVEIPF